MSNNNFEKQVQNKMDELNFVPSEAVWQRVEKQITRRKKRRSLLWLPFLFLILAGTLWIYNNRRETNNEQKQTTKQKIIPATKNNAIVAKEKKLPKKILDHLLLHKEVAKKKNNSEKAPVVVPITISAKSNRAMNKIAHQQVVFGKRKINKVINNNNNKVRSTIEIESETADMAKGPTEISKKNIENNTGKEPETINTIDSSGSQKIDSFAKKIDVAKKENKIDSGALSSAKKVASKKKRKLEWGITANAGLSNVSKGVSGLFGPSASNDQNYSTITPGNNPNAGGFRMPSAVTTNVAFSLGLSARKLYSKTFSVFAGVNYSYYSTSIIVGQKVDSSSSVRQGNLYLDINDFYRAGGSSMQEYTTQYHFIELPIGIEKKFGSKSHFSVITGLTISELITSNVLHYDSQKYIYYKDNNLINKTQLSFFGGVNYRVWQNKATLMELGPELHYGFTNLFKKEIYGKMHLFSIGISARLFFNKK